MTRPARIAAMVLGALLLGGGLLLLPRGAGLPPLVLGLVVLLSLVFEGRYRRVRTERPGAGWQRTGERFHDDESGNWVEVWFSPETGERRYVTIDTPLG